MTKLIKPIYKDHRSYSFAMVAMDVINNPKMTDGALRLYAFLQALKGDVAPTDGYIMKSLGISKPTVTRNKKVLKDLDLLITDQIGMNKYQMFLGDPVTSASVLKAKVKGEEMPKIEF